MFLWSFPCDDNDEDADDMNAAVESFRKQQEEESFALTLKIIGLFLGAAALAWIAKLILGWFGIELPVPNH